MINKKSETKSISTSKVYSLRPKRCHICQKMINSLKYVLFILFRISILACVIAFRKKNLIMKPNPLKNQEYNRKICQQDKLSTREMLIKSSVHIHQLEPKTNFRIKNVSNTIIKNQSTLRDKNQSNLFNPEIQRKFRSTSQANKLVIKKQIKKQQKIRVQLKPDYKQEREKQFKKVQKKQTFENEKKKQEKQTCLKQNQEEREIRDIHQRILQSGVLSSSRSQSQLSHQNNVRLNEHILQPVAQNHTFINHNNLQNQVEQNSEDESSPRNLIEQPRSNNSLFIAQLVSNTAQIINFIQRLNINDQTLDIMVEQLNHVNQIAQQVVQLNSLGNSLGFTMETIFAPRIQQLQNAIISQVSMAILRSFNDRLTSQFQQLIDRNPTLRNGFSKQQIQKNFKVQKCQKQGQCPICLQQYPKDTLTIQLQCKHFFHDDCIQNWFNSSRNCPMCRQEQKIVK